MDYLTTFFQEKQLDDQLYSVPGRNGIEHLITTEVIVELILSTKGTEREKIANIIRHIDFANGNHHHFFQHLARGYVETHCYNF